MRLLNLQRTIIDYILELTDESTQLLFQHSLHLFVLRSLKQEHDKECYNRVLWCLRQGPAYFPAHEHKHLAPGNDKAFFFGIPPWHANGSLNPAGIPPNFGSPESLGHNQALLDDWDPHAGWNCNKCEAWVPKKPRKFEGPDEPIDWWWCLECRNAKTRAPSLAEKKQFKAASNCKHMKTYMLSTKSNSSKNE